MERVDLLDKPEMPAVQAFTLYLSVLQSTGETKSVWVLAGSLGRSAASLTSYKDKMDGCTFSTFEEQMQRRLWVHIKILDSRPQDIPVSDKTFLNAKYDTKAPANLDDVGLYPGMSDAPAGIRGWTDTTTSLIRSIARTLPPRIQDTPEKLPLKLVDLEARRSVLEEIIGDYYLQYVDPNKPLHCFVAASTRLFLTKVQLLLHAKQRSVKTSHRMPTIDEEPSSCEVFDSALTIIELTHSLQNEPKWKGWRWQLRDYRPPYQAIRAVLNHLFTNPLDPGYKRTLSVVQRTLDSVSDFGREDPAHKLVVDLLACAAQRRQACTTHDANIEKSPKTLDGDDLTSETALRNLKSSAPAGDAGNGNQKGESTSREQEQEHVPRITTVTPVGIASDETLGLEMDWEELVREMEPCLVDLNASA